MSLALRGWTYVAPDHRWLPSQGDFLESNPFLRKILYRFYKPSSNAADLE